MIQSFKEFTANGRAGGKGQTLARLYQAGYPVPDGFSIPAGAFNGEALSATAWSRARRELARLRQQAGAEAFAVRSSARGEDSAQASFAGEYETVLGLHTDEQVYEALHTVYGSRRTERVQVYASAQGSGARQHELDVVVQTMVQPALAGVLFTVDPLSGSQGEMKGHYVRGLGDRLVAGEVHGEAFALQRAQGTYDGPPALGPHAGELYRLALQLEAELGAPQDIEWAVSNGRVYILQARPITTLPANEAAGPVWNDSLKGDYLWTNSNFGEAVPDVMTPLTWSMLQMYAEESFPWPVPGDHPLFGNIGGRFYLNISLFASLLQAMGMGRERLAYESEEFFGNLPEDLEIPIIPFSRWQILAQFARFAPRAFLRVRRLRRQLPQFLEEAPQAFAALRPRIEQATTTDELIALWQEDLEPLFRWGLGMLQAGTSRYENAARKLRHELMEKVGEADANALMSGLSRDRDELASLGPVIGMWRVAQGEMSLEAYAKRYGHRGSHEFELSIPRPAEDPGWIEQQRAALQGDNGGIDVAALLAQQEAQKEAAWQRFEQWYPRQAASMRERLERAADAARGREAVRSEIVRIVWLIRAFALRAGRLTDVGDDLFFLSLDELLTLLEGRKEALARVPARRAAHRRLSALPPYPALIRGRFDPQQWARNPARRYDVYDASGTQAARGESEAVVKGFAGAAGVVEGRVRRLDRVEEGHRLQAGEVLVTVTTNIGWTPLFPRAAAIVTDVGAPLSHAAIVARELSIPAVVGAGDATMHLKEGDRVRVDGGQGTVELLSRGDGNGAGDSG